MHFRQWVALATLAPCLPLGGCAVQPGVCGTEYEPLLRPDAGPHRCLRAEECPLPSMTLFCVSEVVLDDDDCIGCRNGQCVRTSIQRCR